MKLSKLLVRAIALVHVLSQQGPCRYKVADLSHMMQLGLRQTKSILARHTECFMKKRKANRRLVQDFEESSRQRGWAGLREVSERMKKGLKPRKLFMGIVMSSSLFELKRGDVTWAEKLLIASIDSMTRDLRGCFAGSEHLAKQIAFSRGTVRNIESKLTRRGYLVTLVSTGATIERVVRPDLSRNPERAKRLVGRYLLSEHAAGRIRISG
jgi:hypothetical protein